MGYHDDIDRSKATAAFVLVTGIVGMVTVLGYHLIAGIQFNRDYSGHLKRAADANSVQLAEKELSIALRYLNERELNTEEGRNRGRIPDYTSIVYSTPDEQISFHYDNIKASLDEVRDVIAKGEEATALERSNLLIKLRESLLNHGKGDASGVQVTYPDGLDVYPHNLRLVVLFVLSGLLTAVSAGYLAVNSER